MIAVFENALSTEILDSCLDELPSVNAMPMQEAADVGLAVEVAELQIGHVQIPGTQLGWFGKYYDYPLHEATASLHKILVTVHPKRNLGPEGRWKAEEINAH